MQWINAICFTISYLAAGSPLAAPFFANHFWVPSSWPLIAEWLSAWHWPSVWTWASASRETSDVFTNWNLWIYWCSDSETRRISQMNLTEGQGLNWRGLWGRRWVGSAVSLAAGCLMCLFLFYREPLLAITWFSASDQFALSPFHTVYNQGFPPLTPKTSHQNYARFPLAPETSGSSSSSPN